MPTCKLVPSCSSSRSLNSHMRGDSEMPCGCCWDGSGESTGPPSPSPIRAPVIAEVPPECMPATNTPRIDLAGEVGVVETGIGAAPLEEVVVGAAFGDPAPIDDQDLVCGRDRGQA